MSSDSKQDVDWDNVIRRGAYLVGGGFLVGCGISFLTSASNPSANFSVISWPVLFSTGVGFGLACVNFENEFWQKRQRGFVTFKNPSTKADMDSSKEVVPSAVPPTCTPTPTVVAPTPPIDIPAPPIAIPAPATAIPAPPIATPAPEIVAEKPKIPAENPNIPAEKPMRAAAVPKISTLKPTKPATEQPKHKERRENGDSRYRLLID